MTEHNSRLGRGLGALLAPRPMPAGSDVRLTGGAEYRQVPIDRVQPNARQPRSVFDEDALAELAASIREVGLLQPVVVRELEPHRFEIVMGERRWRAAQLAGLQSLPVLVRETADDAMLREALLENLHREQLNPLDEAAAYAQLLEDFGATHEQLAERIGRSRAHVTNTLRLLQLSPGVQRRVAAGVLSAGHARAILGLASTEAQERLAARVVAEGLSVRGAEEAAAVSGAAENLPRRPVRRRAAPASLGVVADLLADRLETRVRIDSGRSKGRLVVEFGSLDDLARILGLLAPEATDALRLAREAQPGPASQG